MVAKRGMETSSSLKHLRRELGGRAMEQTTDAKVVVNIDGSRTEYDDMPPEPATLERLLREIFERHWDGITVGPILQGAAYELQYSKPPKVSMGAGYLTVDTGEYHFHLYIGGAGDTAAQPKNPELERQRRVSRAAFFRDVRGGEGCVPGSWGLRLWNGLGEQMMTIYFPNPFFDKQGGRHEPPQWEKLQLWERLRAAYTSSAGAGKA
jgi:hypothetical protein